MSINARTVAAWSTAYSLLVGVVAPVAGQSTEPRVDPAPGAEPVPVLLVPGWGNKAVHVAPLRQRLQNAGWPSTHAVTLTFEDSFGSNEEHAEELASAVDQLREITGVDRVDIVAHSMGGLAVRLYLERGGSLHVRRVVYLGTPHHGTVAATLAWGEGGREMVPGSEFLVSLNRSSGSQDQVEMLAIRSPLDLVVIPGASAVLPGARNLEICCPTHQGLLDDEAAFDQIRHFLLNGVTDPMGPSPLSPWEQLLSRLPVDPSG